MLAHDDAISAALEEILGIVREYGLEPLKGDVETLLRQHSEDPESFRERVLGNEIWGGAGSLCDLYLPSLTQGAPTAVEDDLRLRRAIVRLGEALVAEGIADARVKGRIAILRDR